MTNIIQFPASEFDKLNEAYMSEEERATAAANLAAYYAEQHQREADARGAVREISFDAFTARLAYQQSLQQPTQNEEGVHVGDLFYASWGYEQTNIDFFEVVALKGKHTAVLRQIGGEYIGGYGYQGYVRPKRGSYIDGEEYTVRTRKSSYYADGRVEIKAPHISGHHYLHATTDDAEHAYSSYY